MSKIQLVNSFLLSAIVGYTFFNISFERFEVSDLFIHSLSNKPKSKEAIVRFEVSIDTIAQPLFHVSLSYFAKDIKKPKFKLPIWTPGYYQRMDFHKNISNFNVQDRSGNKIEWERLDEQSWIIKPKLSEEIIIQYDVKPSRPFVASTFLEKDRAYLLAGALCLYPEGLLSIPVAVTVVPFNGWTVATGLPKSKEFPNTYLASNYDILYDSPLLLGKIEELPSFTVKGIPHYFKGVQLGDFDKVSFMNDLKKIVIAATDLIGDIPYKDYTFIAIGPGAGGIEHLNNTTFSFNGNGLNNRQGRLKLLFFLAHEYFHHYNVKRIRPIELGPFDYDKGNRTNMLWVSEGISVYYEYLLIRRAGLCTDEELFEAFQKNILAYETKPGRFYQSLIQASYNTWSDGPFGRSSDEVNKTISYYDKGPVVGLFLDLAIRESSSNKKSLDDVMRYLYRYYYLKKERGFTELEFRQVCERMAGTPLNEIFEYASTTKEMNYLKYTKGIGLLIDTLSRSVPGGWLGINSKMKEDSIIISSVDWDSPAWLAGIRQKTLIQSVHFADQKINPTNILVDKSPGDTLKLHFIINGLPQELNISLGQKKVRNFNINKDQNLNQGQLSNINAWLSDIKE